MCKECGNTVVSTQNNHGMNCAGSSTHRHKATYNQQFVRGKDSVLPRFITISSTILSTVIFDISYLFQTIYPRFPHHLQLSPQGIKKGNNS